MSSSTMGEKMAGNIKNRHLSFHSAEAGLRAGETWAQNITPLTPVNSLGLYDRSYSDEPIWDESSSVGSSAVWINADNAGTEVIQQPQFIIEKFGTSPRDLDCGLENPKPAGCDLPVYRVTSKGWGKNQNSVSIVQSTYKLL